LDPDAVWDGEWVGRGMSVDGVVIVDGKGQFGREEVNLGRPIVTNRASATRLFSNYFEDLFLLLKFLSYYCATN